MVSTYTPNVNFEEPARGDYVGTWDTPVNANETLADLIAGGTASITLNNSPVVLSAAQFQCRQIVFSSTLTGSVAITFPSTFKKDYIIHHTCTGSSAFIITLQTTVAGSQVVACRPGNPFQVYNDGTSIKFVNLGTEIGGEWLYAGSSVPNWVSGCTVPPYLNEDGTAFSSATYPQLAVILGGTTLPDARGRYRATLNGGTGRLTTAGAGVDGNTAYAAGGNNGVTLSASQVPTLSGISGNNTITVTSTVGNVVQVTGGVATQSANIAGGPIAIVYTSVADTFVGTPSLSATNAITVAYTNSSQAVTKNAPPSYVGGMTLIRAA